MYMCVHICIYIYVYIYLFIYIYTHTLHPWNTLRMWFMIPTPPYVVDGVERGSARNRRFALRSDEEVREYLRRRSHQGIQLGLGGKPEFLRHADGMFIAFWWEFHGIVWGCWWDYGNLMGFWWECWWHVYGNLMGNLWYFHGIELISPWNVYGIIVDIGDTYSWMMVVWWLVRGLYYSLYVGGITIIH